MALPSEGQTSVFFTTASVAGPASRMSSSSTRVNGNFVPPHKRIKPTSPYSRTGPDNPEATSPGSISGAGATPSGSVLGTGVTQPPHSDLGQGCSSAASQFPQPTPEPQQSLHIIYDSEVHIFSAKPDADGSIPVSGRVLLYPHPKIHGWTICELQRNTGFITRVDVREFINPFKIGGSRILLRYQAEADVTKPVNVHNLAFPSPLAADELIRLIKEIKQQMDQIEAPWFEQGTLRVQRIGEVDLFTLIEMQQAPNSTHNAVQSSVESSNQVTSQANADVTHDAQQQEDSTPSLIDTSPVKCNDATQEYASSLPMKLIDIEHDDMCKRLPSDDLKDLTFEADSSSAEVELATASKQPSEFEMAEQTEVTDLLENTPDGEAGTDENTVDKVWVHDIATETKIPGAESAPQRSSELEQRTVPVQAPAHMPIQLHDVERLLPMRIDDMSSASLELLASLTKDRYLSKVESVKGLYNGYVLMNLFPDRRLENAILLATLQSLCQNATFRGFGFDNKLKTVAWVYGNMHHLLKSLRITYSVDDLMILGGQPYCPATTMGLIDEMPKEYKASSKRTAPTATYQLGDIQKAAAGSAQFLKSSITGVNQAVHLSSLESRIEPGRLTPPPDLLEPAKQQVTKEVTPPFNGGSNHFSSPITPSPSAVIETKALSQTTDGSVKSIKQEDFEPAIRTEAQPKTLPFPSESQVAGDVTAQQSQAPAIREGANLATGPQTSSPLTPTQTSQVPGNRTGSQGSRSVLPHMRVTRQSLGSAGLSGSRWA